MNRSIYALDIDLGKVFVVVRPWLPGAIDRVAANGVHRRELQVGAWESGALVLCEIASPTSFGRGGQSSAVMHRLAQWAIHNVTVCAQLADTGFDVRVAPSDVWTQGYTRTERHALAKADAKNKDLRECQAMIWSYTNWPTLWKPFDTYIDSL